MSEVSIEPQSLDGEVIAAGTWVRVVGQVIDKPRHPDDTVVEFFSHNEQWAGHVLTERVSVIEPPDFAIPCSRLYEFKDGKYVKCSLTDSHPGFHEGRGQQWSEDETSGYFEEA